MPKQIEGTVVSINSAGNLVSDISPEQLADVPRDERVGVQCDGHMTRGIFTLEHQQPESTLLALIGESGNLELGIVGISMSEMLRIGIGEKIVITWEPE